MRRERPVVSRWRGWLLSGAALAWAVPLPASIAQDPTPRYTAAMLEGAAFDLRVRAVIRTQTGGPPRTETIYREGRLEVRASAEQDTLRLEAWFDSLAVHRDGPEGRLSPATDGLLGGRFGGTLTPDGRYMALVRPFIPDELAEVTDLAGAVTELFPRVPLTSLAVGGRWDHGPLRIVRRADSSAQGGALQRYRWSVVRSDTTIAFLADSLRYETRTAHREEGDLVWHPVAGPLVWHRVTTIEIEIPATGPVRRPSRTHFAEDAWAWRRITIPPETRNPAAGISSRYQVPGTGSQGSSTRHLKPETRNPTPIPDSPPHPLPLCPSPSHICRDHIGRPADVRRVPRFRRIRRTRSPALQ